MRASGLPLPPEQASAKRRPSCRDWAKETLTPTWWEQKLWHLYDATDYATNFYNLPLVVYSGEIDGQKQAADVMDKALTAEGMHMTHIIGPNTAHKYHPDSKPVINAKLDAIAAQGRDAYPRKIRFTTWTLAYNQMKWVIIDGMDQHWERARLNAEILDDNNVDVKASNVSALHWPWDRAARRSMSPAKPA